jgi:hypothetical protein
MAGFLLMTEGLFWHRKLRLDGSAEISALAWDGSLFQRLLLPLSFSNSVDFPAETGKREGGGGLGEEPGATGSSPGARPCGGNDPQILRKTPKNYASIVKHYPLIRFLSKLLHLSLSFKFVATSGLRRANVSVSAAAVPIYQVATPSSSLGEPALDQIWWPGFIRSWIRRSSPDEFCEPRRRLQ